MDSGWFGLNDRVVIVSGAGGGGIGTAVTELVARAGATVIAVDLSKDSVDRFISPLISEGLPILPCVADAQTPEGIDHVMQCALSAPGELHGLVTVVGGAHAAQWKPSLEVSRKDWAELQAWNLESMFFMSQAVAAELKSNGRAGALVATSSISGLGAAPNHVSYGAAKAAILSVVRTLALELAASDIRVNAVAPGAVATPGSLVGDRADKFRDAVPMGRPGHPKEIASTALFLLSDMASYLTGQCLVADGGTSLRWSHFDRNNLPKLVDDDAFKERLMG